MFHPKLSELKAAEDVTGWQECKRTWIWEQYITLGWYSGIVRLFAKVAAECSLVVALQNAKSPYCCTGSIVTASLHSIPPVGVEASHSNVRLMRVQLFITRHWAEVRATSVSRRGLYAATHWVHVAYPALGIAYAQAATWNIDICIRTATPNLFTF